MKTLKALFRSKAFLAALGALLGTGGAILAGAPLDPAAIFSELRAAFVAAAPVISGASLPPHADAGPPP